MSLLQTALREHAETRPQAVALAGGDMQISYGQLPALLESLAVQMVLGNGPLGLMIENTPAWALLDLAAQRAQRPLLPLPQFFSDAQLRHALTCSGVREVLTDDPERIVQVMGAQLSDPQGDVLHVAGHKCRLLRLNGVPQVVLPRDTAKITFTSGTTGEPKGVCLSQAHMDQVAAALAATVVARPSDRHLCMLPLATLLENMGGVYVPLLVGARCELLPTAKLGLSVSSGLVHDSLLAVIEQVQPTTLILVPQLFEALVQAAELLGHVPQSLRIVAVGGAPVASSTLARAAALGLPVHEGYGLSECASVLTLNPPGQQRPGSVGRALSHVRLVFAADGEILVEGCPFLGYLGEAPRTSGEIYATGDKGYLDSDGYLHLTGRKKSMFVTSYGRNVAPEWIERELTAQPAIAQAVVFGESRPWNIAVIQPQPGTDGQAVDQVLASINLDLPDYAQVKSWLLASAPFSPANGQLTANGRLRRSAIHTTYCERIQALYL